MEVVHNMGSRAVHCWLLLRYAFIFEKLDDEFEIQMPQRMDQLSFTL